MPFLLGPSFIGGEEPAGVSPFTCKLAIKSCTEIAWPCSTLTNGVPESRYLPVEASFKLNETSAVFLTRGRCCAGGVVKGPEPAGTAANEAVEAQTGIRCASCEVRGCTEGSGVLAVRCGVWGTSCEVWGLGY